MVRVMQEVEVTRPQQIILLAMAEHANDDGTRCYPSIDRIAWKTGYKVRAVEDILRGLRQEKIIEMVAPAAAQKPTEYRICLDKAKQKMPFSAWRFKHGKHRNKERGAENAPVQSRVKSARETAPEPSTEPSLNKLKGFSEADDISRSCAVQLLKVKNFPKSHIFESIEELREDFPFVDAVRVCKDYRVWCQDKPYQRPRSGLRRFFTTAENSIKQQVKETGSATINGKPKRSRKEKVN